MQARDDSNTSPTLLGRLALVPTDQVAWNEFVDRYGPRIVNWCRSRGLQDADILDVSQVVLAKLAVRMRGFHYDPSQSFRGWLRTLVRNAVSDALVARRRAVGIGASETRELLANLEAREDLVRRLEEEFDHELLEAATLVVRQRVASKTWEAYYLTTIEERPATDVAAALEMKVGTVYQAKSSVLHMLEEEVVKLERGFCAPRTV